MERRVRFRTGVILTLIFFISAVFVFRLYKIQETDGQEIDAQMLSAYTYQTTVKAARGNILDRNGEVLVSNRASYNIEIVYYVFFNGESPNESLLKLVNLCKELGIAYTDHLPISREKPYTYTLDSTSQTWQDAFKTYLSSWDWDSDISAQTLMKLMKDAYKIPDTWTEEEAREVIGLRYELSLRTCTSLEQYVLAYDVTSEQLAAIMELSIPGVVVETTTVREYQTPYAAHILGHIGLMNDEEVAQYQEEGYPLDAKVGKDGIEQAFESYLHGTDGVKTTTIAADGTILDEHYITTPEAGDNVELTIDIDVQAAAEDALEDVILDLRENGVGSDEEGKDAEGGAVVVVECKTGEVLASASYPTFDPGTYSQNFNALLEEEYGPLFNRALLQTYPPGSVYKMVTAIAAIDDAGISRYLQIEDKGVYTRYEGYQPKCHIYTSTGTTHGVINMMQALSVSCNYYFYEVGRQTGITAMDLVAKGLGLGEATGVELPESVGYRANAETKALLHKDDETQSGWYDADTIMAAIGQSENKFTPMQMACYTAALANRGTRYEATFLSRVFSADYSQVIREHEPTVASRLAISQDAIACVQEGMELAATEGTAATYLKDYPIKVCAKTGTAQHGDSGSDHASFVCYAPADDPEIAIAVYVEKGAQGGNLARVATAVMDVYFNRSQENDTIQQENLLS